MTHASRQVHVIAIKNLFDELIDRHAEAYLAAYPEIREFSSFEKSGTYNDYIGMVWTNDNEKPDTKTLRLRGSASMTKNKLVELDLSSVAHDSSFTFFPGQIVALRGEPYTRSQLGVARIYDPVKIAPPLKKLHVETDINLIVAAGPFVTRGENHDDWSLFEKLLVEVKEKQATHAILLGPFVDVDNKPMRDKFDTNWRQVLDKLMLGLQDHSCHVYLVPSSRDILPSNLGSAHYYPCPPFDVSWKLKSNAQPKCHIQSVSDPAQIELTDGLFVDVTSAEVLGHMTRCLASLGPVENKFEAIFKHLITHGIYPLYPASNSMAVDHPKMHKYLSLDRLAGHLLVLPTRFSTKPVVEVEGRLVLTAPPISTRKQAILVHIPAATENLAQISISGDEVIRLASANPVASTTNDPESLNLTTSTE